MGSQWGNPVVIQCECQCEILHRDSPQTHWSCPVESPQENVLNLSSIYDEYDGELINKYLTQLTPDNLRVMLIAPDLDTDKTEVLYNTPYSIHPLSDDVKKAWLDTTGDAGLHLPAPNKFIASKTDIKPKSESSEIPTLLVNEEGMSLWHLQDPSFARHERA